MQNFENEQKQNTISAKIKDFLKRKNPTEYFIAIMILSIVIFGVFSILKGVNHLRSLFFLDGKDAFMDFFNSVRDASVYSGAYTDRNVIYPPMANLLFLLFNLIIPDAYTNTDFTQRQTWMNYPLCIVAIAIFVVITITLYLFVFSRETKFIKKGRFIFCIFLILNVPIFHLVERANIIILSTTCAVFFLFNYDSENRVLKELSLILLAFSFSLKLYPAVLGWVLVCDKKYKEIIRLVIYALLMLIIPSFFFGGPKCIWWMIENIINFSKIRVGYDDVIVENIQKIGFSQVILKVYQIFTLIASVICIITFLVSSFFIKDKWKLLLFACSAFFSIPPVTALYGWIIFFVPLFLFLKTEKLEGINWIYFFLMILPFTFIPEIISLDFLQNAPTYNSLITKASSIILVFVLCFDGIYTIVKSKKDGKKESV